MLAESIKHNLIDIAIPLETRIQGAPLIAIQGADMPAILIEISYISELEPGKKLQESSELNHAAKGIGDGIRDFFLKRGQPGHQ